MYQQSIVGPYPPVPYLAVGAAGLAAGDSGVALYAERSANALLSLVLLAVALFWGGTAWTRLAIFFGVTPTVLFMSSAVTTSGLEITAALAHTTVLLALIDRPTGGRQWWAWAATGAVLVLTRPLGPLWLAILLLLPLAMVRSDGLRARLRCDREAAVPAVAGLGAAAVFAIGWAVVAMPHNRATAQQAAHFLGPAFRSFPDLLTEAVGVFGWLDVRLPTGAVLVAGTGWALLLGVALFAGTARDRIVLSLCVGALFGLVILLQVFTQMPFGFGAQGRYVMPLVVSVLVLAGRTIDLRLKTAKASSRRSWLFGVGIAAMTALHWLGWYVNARRAAVGLDGPWLFIDNPQWEPWLGWVPWLVISTLGCLLVARGARYSDDRFFADVEGSATS